MAAEAALAAAAAAGEAAAAVEAAVAAAVAAAALAGSLPCQGSVKFAKVLVQKKDAMSVARKSVGETGHYVVLFLLLLKP